MGASLSSIMMISVGTSSPWRTDWTQSSKSFGRLREQMMSDVGGRLTGVRELRVTLCAVSEPLPDPCLAWLG